MGIQSLRTSGINNFVRSRSMLVGNEAFDPSDFELIATTILTTSQPSVTFSGLEDYSSTYKHLQLRIVGRSTRTETDSFQHLQFNSDTSSNYNSHAMRADGSAWSSGVYSDPTYITGIVLPFGVAGASLASGVFGATIVDIVDPFSSSKFKVTRSLTGQSGTYNRVGVTSGLWRSLTPISSITLDDIFANFSAGSRFSLYGIKG